MIKKLIFYVSLMLLPLVAQTSSVVVNPSNVDQCLKQAAMFHRVDYALLRAIAMQESGGRPQVVNVNSDGSKDYGLMQINSSWLSKLAVWGIGVDSLLDPCVNAHVGAWILAGNFRRMGMTWSAVGAYNAVSDVKRAKYAWAIYKRLNTMTDIPVVDRNVSTLAKAGGLDQFD